MAARTPQPSDSDETVEARVRQLEAELEAVRAELSAAAEKQRTGDESFRRFSDSGIVGIRLFDPSGRFRYANSALLQMFGCSAEAAFHAHPIEPVDADTLREMLT